MKNTLITLKSVNFKYTEDNTHLKDISLEIKSGEVILLTGPSGCGKTTITRCLNGLIPHFYEGTFSGYITFFGKTSDKIEAWEFGRKIGCVFQNPKSQFFVPKVEDEIVFAAENYGLNSDTIKQRRETVIDTLKIGYIRKQFLQKLSSGEKQKVAFASAMMLKPEIYILDEPSANLDMKSTLALREIIKKLKEQGASIVIAEHRIYYLMGLIDRAFYIRNGSIAQEYTGSEFEAFTDEKLQELGLRNKTVNYYINVKHTPNADYTALLDVSNLKYKYRSNKGFLLNDVSFSIQPGDVVALTGENGAGKTTLAKLLCGLLKEHAGKILFKGKKVYRNYRQKHLWFVMQETACQLFSESVYEEMLIALPKDEETKNRCKTNLEQLGLYEKSDHHPMALSGGEAQRLTFGVAMMQNTELIVFDEPTSGLDGINLKRVINFIKKLQSMGKGIMVITHDHEFISGACNRLMFLEDGKIIKDEKLTSESYRWLLSKWQ